MITTETLKEALRVCSSIDATCDKCPLYKPDDDECLCSYELKETALHTIDILQRANEKLIRKCNVPCNIGDTIYSVGSVTQDIVELTVEAFQIATNDTFIFCNSGIYISVSQQLNKSVFLTREEAEECIGRIKNEHTA